MSLGDHVLEGGQVLTFITDIESLPALWSTIGLTPYLSPAEMGPQRHTNRLLEVGPALMKHTQINNIDRRFDYANKRYSEKSRATGGPADNQKTGYGYAGDTSELNRMSQPQKVRLMLQQLGPMYVKLSQIVSSQGESLPEEWHQELDKLQSTVAPFPYGKARQMIISELGAPPEELFAMFNREPLAAASTAQVHRATLHSGEQVVVKVQRPNIIRQVQSDLRIMQDFSQRLKKRFEWARDMDLVGMVDEFAAGISKELDYRNEAYHMLRLADNMASLPRVHVPILDLGLVGQLRQDQRLDLDILSFSLNYETTAIVYNEGKAKELEAQFLEDLKQCEEWTLKGYKQFSPVYRFVDSVYRLTSPIL